MSTHSSSATSQKRQTLGALLLFLGVGLGTLVLLDSIQALPWTMPPSWYVERPLWGTAGLLLCLAGWKLQQNQYGLAPWQPAVMGRRFGQLVVYSRRECHLCDDAKAVLHKYIDYLPPFEDVDIDTDPKLQEQFGTSIPVVEIDGVVRFRGQVDENLLRRLIEANAPRHACPSQDTTGRCSSL